MAFCKSSLRSSEDDLGTINDCAVLAVEVIAVVIVSIICYRLRNAFTTVRQVLQLISKIDMPQDRRAFKDSVHSDSHTVRLRENLAYEPSLTSSSAISQSDSEALLLHEPLLQTDPNISESQRSQSELTRDSMTSHDRKYRMDQSPTLWLYGHVTIQRLVSICEIILSCAILVYGVIFNSIEGCTDISSFLVIGIRIFGWVVVYIYSILQSFPQPTLSEIYSDNDTTKRSGYLTVSENTKQESLTDLYDKSLLPTKIKSLRSFSIYLCLAWSISAVISGGMNSSQYVKFDSNIIVSIIVLGYFIIAVIAVLSWIYLLVKVEYESDEPSHSDNKQNSNLFSILSAFRHPIEPSESHDSPRNTDRVVSSDMKFWATHKSNEHYNIWGIPSSDHMVDIRLSDPGSRNSEIRRAHV